MGRIGERVAALRDPALKETILREHAELMAAVPDGLLRQLSGGFDVMFRLTDPVDYEPTPDRTIAAMAAASGRDPLDVLYDAFLERDVARGYYTREDAARMERELRLRRLARLHRRGQHPEALHREARRGEQRETWFAAITRGTSIKH